MVHINPGDLPALPVEQLAQFLLGCAREDPTLLARSNSGPVLRRGAEARMPLGRPVGTARPADTTATPVVGGVTQNETPAGPIEAVARHGHPAATSEATETRGEPPARPVVALKGPIDSTPGPIVPSSGPIDSPTVSIEALTGPAASASRPIVPSFGQIARLPVPIEALAGPRDAAPRPIVRSFRRIDSPTPPVEALTGPVNRSSRPVVPSFLGPEATSGPVDATARMAAQKLQLRRSDDRDDPELEELVSIAVACARRAEDALQQAREISWMARRRMSVVAAVTGAGVLAASGVGILDRYHSAGGHHLPTIASAVIAGPSVTEPALPTAAAPAPAMLASSSGGPVSPPANHAPVQAAIPGPPQAAAAEPVSVAAAVQPPHEPATPGPVNAAVPPPAARPPVSVAAVVPPPVKQVESVPGTNVGPGSSPEKSVDPAAPATAVAQARPPAPAASVPDGNSSGGVPADQTSAVSASLDVAPGPRAAQASHPVRHVRRAGHRVIYYVNGPGVLLAQVVYGVRRNIYDIFH